MKVCVESTTQSWASVWNIAWYLRNYDTSVRLYICTSFMHAPRHLNRLDSALSSSQPVNLRLRTTELVNFRHFCVIGDIASFACSVKYHNMNSLAVRHSYRHLYPGISFGQDRTYHSTHGDLTMASPTDSGPVGESLWGSHKNPTNIRIYLSSPHGNGSHWRHRGLQAPRSCGNSRVELFNTCYIQSITALRFNQFLILALPCEVVHFWRYCVSFFLTYLSE